MNELELADRGLDRGDSAGEGIRGDGLRRTAGDMRIRAGVFDIGEDAGGRVTKSSSWAIHVDSEVRPRFLRKSVCFQIGPAAEQHSPEVDFGPCVVHMLRYFLRHPLVATDRVLQQ